VRRDLDVGPVPRPEQEGRVDLVDVCDAAAIGHREVHGLTGVLADRLEHRPGQASHLPGAVVPRGVEGEQGTADVLTGVDALDQPSALERREEPRRGGARQPRGFAQLREGHRDLGLDHLGEQGRSAVNRLGSALTVSGRATRALDGRRAAHA
jgi:hypothetical protein